MNATDWIGIGVIVLVIVGGLLLLNQVTKPYDVKNEEEFEKRRKEGGLLSAGMMGLQQILDPSARKAVEVQQDLRRGIYDDKEEADDPPGVGVDARDVRSLVAVAGVAGQDEIPDLMEIAVWPPSRQEHERQYMIDRYPFCADVGERFVAVGAAPVLITAERVADARYRAAAQPGRHVQVDGRVVRGYLERD